MEFNNLIEDKLIKMMLNCKDVMAVEERDPPSQLYIPPYGIDDFVWQDGGQSRCYIKFDNKECYFLQKEDMIRVYDKYIEIRDGLSE